jgi:hypothetical protein
VPAGLALVRADPTPGPAAPRPVWQDPGPPPAGDPCLPVPARGLPAPVPADQLPRQSGVRGSLGADEALVDRALVAAWQGFRVPWATEPAPAWDPRTLRVQFVERAGAGVLALVVASDPSGRHASIWVVGRDQWLVPTGGETENSNDVPPGELGELFWGEDPLLVSSRQVCRRTYGVVLAPPDSTAALTSPVRIGPDGRPDRPPSRSTLPLVGGLAVFPAEAPATTRVAVSRPDGGTLADRALNLNAGGYDAATLVSDAQVAAAVAAGGGAPDRTLVRMLAQQAAGDLYQSVVGRVTAVRVPWGGPLPGGRHAALVALTLPSGAMYVNAAIRERSSYDGFYSGLLPAGQLDDTVLAWQHPDGTVVVVAPAAVRAEVVLADRSVRPVPLSDGGGSISVAGVEVTLVRAYRADGSPLAARVPGTGLIPLPRQE